MTNTSKKYYGKSSMISMFNVVDNTLQPELYLSDHLSFKLKNSTLLSHETKNVISSISDEGFGQYIEDQEKPFFSMGPTKFGNNHSHIDFSKSDIGNPYPCVNFHSRAYESPVPIQPRNIELTSSRIALPLLDTSGEAPIYVNAKQYNCILRRRLIRAKLDARRKLVKSRKPYLHESRHRHALNRIRGTGGRFLSKNKSQDSVPNLNSGFKALEKPNQSCQNGYNDSDFQKRNQLFTPFPSHRKFAMQDIGG